MTKKIFSLLLTFSLLFSTACWDTKDLSERSYISALAIDTNDNGGTSPLKVSIEVINPVILNARVSGASGDQPVHMIYTVEGESIPMALDQLQTMLPHPISLSHLRVLLIGEELAKENFNDLANFFEKQPEVARRLRLMFVQGGEALDVLNTTPKFEPYIAQKLVSMTNWERDLPLIRFNIFTSFLRNLRTAEGRAFGTRIILSPNREDIILSGGAVFDNWRLVDFLDGEETRKANWLKEEVNRTAVTCSLEDCHYTYRINSKSTEMEAIVENGKISFKVLVKTNGRIIHEQGEPIDLNSPKNITRLEKMFDEEIKKEVEDAIAKSQKELQVDYLAFDMCLLDEDPALFKSLNWKEVYPEIPIKVEVESTIGRLIIAR